ncbi:NADPH dehydrogenase [Rhizodiscina lignyota]|uniref:NADPH dehydrogenase n=1 Tax=Rhizodiscina lignyota TaxID=1504668 RepID=A0A9P4I596_9PEZI|nr:NADPH dehydrogenase [Rhizodiscina lignyota]
MAPSSSSKLFQPLKVGNVTLNQRLVMAPLTRFRADTSHVPLPFVKEYYAQRASVPGTLLISEATFISPRAGGLSQVPGIWTPAQIAGWKEVTDAVHEKGSYIFLQLWCLGRAANADNLREEFGLDVISSSDLPIDANSPTPRPMKEEEIWDLIGEYVQAAKNAVERAGFDGVEIHGANGYIIDQFTQDTSNKRTDKWGGSIENRSRFGLEVASAVVNAIGKEKTGIRLSPFSEFQAMKMQEPIPQFSHLVTGLKKLELAYIHLVESRISGNIDVEGKESLRPLVEIWDNVSPVLLAGGFTAESAKKAVDEEYKDKDVAVVFGRYWISTPDLVYRIKKGLELTKYDRSLFYNPGSPKGYVDYPFSPEFVAEQSHVMAKA